VSELEQGAGRIEAADPESCCASSVDPNLAAAVLDAGDVSQWDSQPGRPVAGEEGVGARDLELAHMFWAVALVPPDRVATSTHVHRLRFLASECISTRAQGPCGKPAGLHRLLGGVVRQQPARQRVPDELRARGQA
jgi:hypothetical protein